jgi:hypothetical protein
MTLVGQRLRHFEDDAYSHWFIEGVAQGRLSFAEQLAVALPN